LMCNMQHDLYKTLKHGKTVGCATRSLSEVEHVICYE
jgi:hypothetical protein